MENNDLEANHSKISEIAQKNDTDNIKLDNHSNMEKDTAEKSINNLGSPSLPPISKKIEDESDEPIIPKLTGLYLLVY